MLAYVVVIEGALSCVSADTCVCSCISAQIILGYDFLCECVYVCVVASVPVVCFRASVCVCVCGM